MSMHLKGKKKKKIHLQKQIPECKISHFEQPHLKGLPFFYTTDLIFFFFLLFWFSVKYQYVVRWEKYEYYIKSGGEKRSVPV